MTDNAFLLFLVKKAIETGESNSKELKVIEKQFPESYQIIIDYVTAKVHYEKTKRVILMLQKALN